MNTSFNFHCSCDKLVHNECLQKKIENLEYCFNDLTISCAIDKSTILKDLESITSSLTSLIINDDNILNQSYASESDLEYSDLSKEYGIKSIDLIRFRKKLFQEAIDAKHVIQIYIDQKNELLEKDIDIALQLATNVLEKNNSRKHPSDPIQPRPLKKARYDSSYIPSHKQEPFEPSEEAFAILKNYYVPDTFKLLSYQRYSHRLGISPKKLFSYSACQ